MSGSPMTVSCECGHVVHADEPDALQRAAARHAWSAHGIVLPPATLAALARTARDGDEPGPPP